MEHDKNSLIFPIFQKTRKQTDLDQTMSNLASAVSTMTHASICKDHKCRVYGCHKAKKMFSHSQQCKKTECQVCSRLRKLASVHAADCQLQGCKFAFCKRIKHKWEKGDKLGTEVQGGQ
jgi:hypothetical protein